MGIEMYLLVAWWLGLVGIVARALTMLVADYPRQVEHKIGSDIITLLLSIFFFVWLCFLRFGQ